VSACGTLCIPLPLRPIFCVFRVVTRGRSTRRGTHISGLTHARALRPHCVVKTQCREKKLFNGIDEAQRRERERRERRRVGDRWPLQTGPKSWDILSVGQQSSRTIELLQTCEFFDLLRGETLDHTLIAWKCIIECTSDRRDPLVSRKGSLSHRKYVPRLSPCVY